MDTKEFKAWKELYKRLYPEEYYSFDEENLYNIYTGNPLKI